MTLDEEPPPALFTASTPDEYARGALLRILADVADRLHHAIEAGVDEKILHDIIGLWEANNINEGLTYANLVESGQPDPCDDCTVDVMPYDEFGRPFEGGWEYYMVTDEVWTLANANQDEEATYLCIGCLKNRLGRFLTPDDFSDFSINEPSYLDTDRLRSRRSGQPTA